MSAADPGTVLDELSDPELIARVRDGDVDAYGQLFSRHVDAATRLARILVGAPDGDDLVSEAFVKVLDVLLGGGGPDVAFRAYLLTAVRRLHIDKVRAGRRLTTTDDLTPYDPGVPFVDPAVASFEGGAAARAFSSLPERWQMVLWHLEVENSKPADIAPLLGISANSVSALAYRAREGLRQAFLNMHSGDLPTGECREIHDLLGGYVRGALSRRDTAKVEVHLDHCRPCTAVYLELAEVNSSLSGLLGPLVLGGAAAAYAGSLTGAGGGVLALLAQAKALALAHLPATLTAASVGIAGVVTGVVVTTGPDQPRAEAGTPSPTPTFPSPTPTPTSTEQPVSPARPRRTTSPATATASPTATATPGAGATASPQPGSSPGADTGTGDTGTEGSSRSTGDSGDREDPAGGGGRPTSDTFVRARPGPVQQGRATVVVTVGGVPRGQRARVRVSGSATDFTVGGSGCQRSGGVSTCSVPGPSSTLTVRAAGARAVTVTVRVTGPAGWTDPQQADNTATATLAATADPPG